MAKYVTLDCGHKITEVEFIKQYYGGDLVTEFVATKEDLELLAWRLVDEIISGDFYLRLQVSRQEIDWQRYLCFRLERVMDFLPEELNTKIQQKLSDGFSENPEAAERLSDEWAYPKAGQHDVEIEQKEEPMATDASDDDFSI
jgi:hypothetical protein